MRSAFYSIAAAAALMIGVATAGAQPTQLLYSFEEGEVAFAATAGSSAATSTQFGVTNGTQSLQYNWQGTFVGARSAEATDADIINGINLAETIRLDLTNVPEGGPSGAFSDIFLVIFSAGNQYQTNGIAMPRPDEATRPFTTSIDLPLTLFGTSDRIPQLDPNSSFIFQITINSVVQSPQSTVYFDNVRAVIPEPASLTGLAAGAMLLIRRRGIN